MRMTLRAIAISAVAICTMTAATATTPTPSDRQIYIMKSAYHIAKEDGLEDPSMLQGIVMTESTAGMASSKIHNGSVGVSQILVGTAKHVLLAAPHLADEYFPKGFTKGQLIKKLADDDIFNLRIASAYLKIISKENRLRGDRLIAAYNRGPGAIPRNPEQLDYVKKVRRFAKSDLAISSKRAVLEEPVVIDEFTLASENDTMK